MMNKPLPIAVLMVGLLIGGIVAGVLGQRYWETRDVKCSTGQCSPPPSSSNHSMTISNDAEFVMGMIPHHQEAVDTSAYMLTRTTDPELQSFLMEVIQVQSQEITMMKNWHQEWFNSEYVPDNKYMPMMGDLTVWQGKALEKAYIEGMIAHHRGALSMAEQILPITNRTELRTMAEAILRQQSSEITTMESWLQKKYQGVDSNVKSTQSNHMNH